VALDYGGHWDIAQAVSQYVQHHQGEAPSAQDDSDTAAITTELRSYLSTSDLPDPDLCIRTGGEHRLSNFLLWQLAYTELYFSDTYWPDFDKKELGLALNSYDKRIRNFGRTADRS
jgi:undecaprenyl diphosphate synthase